MAKPRYLKNAPITEAIIDFRVKVATGFNVTTFASLTSMLAKDFPNREERRLFQGTIEIRPGLPVSQFTRPEELDGFWFKSADGLNIAQFRRDGFTFSRMKPYTRWEEVFPKAWELWRLYVGTGAAEFGTRIAVRYLNRIDVPAPVSDLAAYLTAPPTAPEGIDGEIASFLSRVVVKTRRPEGLIANVTQALDNRVDSRNVAIILDIDVYRQKDFEIEDKNLDANFGALRQLKNDIFFNSITENTARLCDEYGASN